MLPVCRFLIITASIVCTMGVPSFALAEESNTAAEVLFREGREALAKGEYSVACDKFEQSDRLDPAPGTRLNLGECELQRGRVATAYFLFLSVLSQLNESDVRVPLARSKREAAEKRLPKLLLKLPPNAPQEVRVIVRGRLYFGSELVEPLILDPGLVDIAVGAPGLNPSHLQVQMEEAKLTTVDVSPQTFGAAPMLQPQPAPTQASVTPRRTAELRPKAAHVARNSSRKSGVVFLGIGIAGGVLGGVAGIVTLDAKSTNRAHCNSVTQTCDSQGRDAASRGQLFGPLTTAGLAISVLGISVGTYLFTREEPKKASARLQLRSSGTSAEFSLVQPF